jgi:hypothetical protein
MSVIERLLAATPLPPVAGIDDLLAAFDKMFTARKAILAELGAPVALTEAERGQLAEIEQRDAAWQQAFAEALREITQHRLGARRLRAYAAP